MIDRVSGGPFVSRSRLHGVVMAMAMTLCAGLSAVPGRAAVRVDVSTDPPGGLAPTNTPQMILVTFDDAVNGEFFDTIQSILTNRVNPNGTPIRATFFVSTDWSDYWLIQRLHAQGHEIGVHTMTHLTSMLTDRVSWRAEIAGCRRALSRFAGIPREEIRGFRAPFLEYNNDSFQILAEQGLAYDTSITETLGLNSVSLDRMIWPYTLDDGVKQNCWTGIAPTGTLPGLFEIPMLSLSDPGDASWMPMDPTGSDAQVSATLQTNFLVRYNGNRAPLGVFLHATNWVARPQVVRAFLDWAQTHPDVWIVNLSALTAFMQTPQTISAAYTFPPFVTVTNPAIPEGETQLIYFGDGPVRTCGEVPSFYPRPDTIYRFKETVPGGTLSFEQTTEPDPYYYEAKVVVSNDTTQDAYQWDASFELPGSTISWSWPGTDSWRQEGSTIILNSEKFGVLSTGTSYTLVFGGVPAEATVQVQNQTIALHMASPLKPRFSAIGNPGDGQVRLDWDDSAFGYAVEQATNGLGGGWERVAQVYGATHWTSAVPASASSVFYRLQGIP